MASQRLSRIPRPFPSFILTLLVAGCAEGRSTDPVLISIDPDQMTWQSPEGAFWGIADVLERDGVIWVLSPVDPFIHGLRSGTEVVAFGSQGEGPWAPGTHQATARASSRCRLENRRGIVRVALESGLLNTG